METNIQDLIKKAESGDAEAQFQLATAYYFGNGIEENKEEAFDWFLKVAGLGVAEAQYNIAFMYYNNEGRETENALVDAMYWLWKVVRHNKDDVTEEMMQNAHGLMNEIRLLFAREMGFTKPEETSDWYTDEIVAFREEISQKVDEFIADCKLTKNYRPSSYIIPSDDADSSNIIYFVPPFPVSVREKGFKEDMVAHWMSVHADELWSTGEREKAHAYLDACWEYVKTFNYPWVADEWLFYLNRKAQYYKEEGRWEDAVAVYQDIVAFHRHCDMSQFAEDDENIYENMTQKQLDDLMQSEDSFYNAFLSLIACLVNCPEESFYGKLKGIVVDDSEEEGKEEDIRNILLEFFSFIVRRIQGQDSYVADQWLADLFKNEKKDEGWIIRILKEEYADTYITLVNSLCWFVIKAAEDEGIGNGYQWERCTYELMENMLTSAIPYVESLDAECRDSLSAGLHFTKGVYMLQTRRIVLAEKEFNIALDLYDKVLEKERVENVISLYINLIRLFCILYQEQRKTDKKDFIRSLIEKLHEEEKQGEDYERMMEEAEKFLHL